MSNTKYLAKLNWHDIEQVSIVRETENSYWTEEEPNKKRAKKTDHEKLCDTELQAKECILGVILGQKNDYLRRAQEIHEKYIKVCQKFDM